MSLCLDDLDRKILAVLQEDARRPAELIGAGIVVTARDVEDYDALLQKLVSENSNVRRFRTRVALGTLKRGCRVPVE